MSPDTLPFDASDITDEDIEYFRLRAERATSERERELNTKRCDILIDAKATYTGSLFQR